MKTTSIYVFSATGNSLTTADELQRLIPGSKLISVASLRFQDDVIEDAERTIFVFPVYFQDVPYPVKSLIQKMTWTNSEPKIYCLSTSRKVPSRLDVYKRLHALLQKRGQSLYFAMGIPMPGNSWSNSREEDEEYLLKQKENIHQCIAQMEQGARGDYSLNGTLNQTPISSLNNYRGLIADETCIGCGRCAEVCPMNNIVLQNGKAMIGDNCAVCLACFHWCPKEALWMSKNMEDGRRKKYHHPDIKFKDIVKLKAR